MRLVVVKRMYYVQFDGATISVQKAWRQENNVTTIGISMGLEATCCDNLVQPELVAGVTFPHMTMSAS